jgi:hypothetical protein
MLYELFIQCMQKMYRHCCIVATGAAEEMLAGAMQQVLLRSAHKVGRTSGAVLD